MQTASGTDTAMIEDLPAPGAADILPCVLATIAILIAVGAGMFFWYCHPLLIFSDQGLYMHMAKLFMKGWVPYLEMFEINPPLAIYLHIPPMLAAYALKITEPQAFAFYIWSLILAAGTISGVALWRSGSKGALYVGLGAIFGMACYSQRQLLDFGQRDHLFAILYFPFFIVRYLRWQGLKVDRSVAIIAGLMGGLGIALKHYFLLVALAPEIVWALDKRTIRPLFRTESFTAAAVGIFYLLHFLFLPRGELDTFFGFIVPIYQAGYSYYTTSLSFNLLLSRADFYQMAYTTVTALALARYSSFLLPLQAFSLMSMVIFVLAGQVWTCHTVEIRMASDMAFFAQAVVLVRYLPSMLKKYNRVGPIVLALTAIAFACDHVKTTVTNALHDRDLGEVFFVPSIGGSVNSPSDDIDRCTRLILEKTQKDDSILFISSAMAPGYPVFLQCDRRPASRFLHGMVLPILSSLIDSTKDAEKEEHKNQLHQVMTWYGEDIDKNKPKLIFVQIRFIDPLLNQYDFYNKQMAGYQKIEEIGDYRAYLREF